MYKFIVGENKKDMPEIYVDYLLCKKFGWTPEQVDRIDIKTINWFLYIMGVEAMVIAKNNQKNLK